MAHTFAQTSYYPQRSNSTSTGTWKKRPEYRASLEPPPLDVAGSPAPRPSFNTWLQDRGHVYAPGVEDPTPAKPSKAYINAAKKVHEWFGVEDNATELHAEANRRDSIGPPLPSRLPSLWRRSLNAYLSVADRRSYGTRTLEGVYGDSELPYQFRNTSMSKPALHSETTDHKSLTGSLSSQSSLPLHKQDAVAPNNNEPQNGRLAWLHALTGMLVVFNCWGIGNAYGVFQAYYSTVYLSGSDPSSIAWIGSTQIALVFGLGVPVGRLVDKGYFRIVFHGGSLLMVAGLMLSSSCTQLWSIWLVNGLITGSGMGMCFTSGVVALMTWFDERRAASAMALGAAGSCIGGIVYVLLARTLLQKKGFRGTMLVLGALAAVTMIPPNLVFRVRGQSHRMRPSTETVPPRRLDWRMFVDKSYLFATSGLFFSFLGVYFGFAFLPSFGVAALKMSQTASSNLLIFMLVANIPGRFLPALISDKCIGPLNTMIPSVLLSSAVIWLWAASGEHRGAITMVACFYGFVSAGIQVLYAPTIRSFCLEPVAKDSTGIDDKELAMDHVGLKAGGMFSCIGLACLIGLPIGGALINYRTSRHMDQPYLGAQIFAGLSLLLGGCLLLASRVAKTGWKARRA